jgi:hypothetical protein
MGFGGHVSEMNSRMKQFRDGQKLRRDRRQKLMDNYRKVSKKEKSETHEKPFNDFDRKQFAQELKQERQKSTMKEIMFVLIALLLFGVFIWYLLF